MLCGPVQLLLFPRKFMTLDKGYQRQEQAEKGKNIVLPHITAIFPCLLLSLFSFTNVDKFDYETATVQLQILFVACMEGKNIILYKAANSSPCQCYGNNRKNVIQQIDAFRNEGTAYSLISMDWAV